MRIVDRKRRKRAEVVRTVRAMVLAVLVFFGMLNTAQATQLGRVPNVSSAAYVVIDADTGQVLISKSMDTPMAPASITKVMTIALSMEMGANFDDVVTVNGDTVRDVFKHEADSSHMSLMPGERVTVRDLIMGTQLLSANDGAAVLAEHMGGTVENFVSLMNAKAKELGLKNTSFRNPHGLDEKRHYISPKDMAEITRYALSVDGFAEVFGALKYTMPETNLQKRGYTFYAADKLVVPSSSYYYKNIRGSKLGYTTNAKNTATSFAEYGGMRLICVTMSAPSRGNLIDTKVLFDYCFENFEKMTITSDEIEPVEVPLAGVQGGGSMVVLKSTGEHSFIVPKGTVREDIDISYKVPQVITEGLEYDAKFMFTMGGNVVYTGSLFTKDYGTLIPAGEYAVPTNRLPQGRVMSDAIVVVLYLAITMVFVGCIVFLCYRIAVIMGYSARQRKKRRLMVELEARRRQARIRNQPQLASIRAESDRLIRTTK